MARRRPSIITTTAGDSFFQLLMNPNYSYLTSNGIVGSVEGEGINSPRDRALVILSSKAVAFAMMMLHLVGPPLPPPLVAALQHSIPDQLHLPGPHPLLSTLEDSSFTSDPCDGNVWNVISVIV